LTEDEIEDIEKQIAAEPPVNPPEQDQQLDSTDNINTPNGQ
jgi:hypothetical protein